MKFGRHQLIRLISWSVFLGCIDHGNTQARTSTYGMYILEQRFEDKIKPKSAAETSCSKKGGWLVRIKDAKISSAVTTLLSSGSEYYWIGLDEYGDFTPRQWRWNDGTNLTYENWRSDEPNKGHEDCVMAEATHGRWLDVACNGEYPFKYVCQRDPCSPNPCKNNRVCSRSTNSPYYTCACESAYEGSSCENPKYFSNGTCKYHINYDSKLEFTAASAACTDLGGSLAEIKTKAIHEFIESKANYSYPESSKIYLWFGGIRRYGTWAWMDQTLIPLRGSSEFQKWNQYKPTADKDRGCAFLSTHWDVEGAKDTFEWANNVCSSEKGYVCEKINSPNNPCSGINCSHHGTCQSIGCHWKCRCEFGFWGQNCEYLFGKPKLETVKNSNCSANVQLNITWIPNNRTITNHRLAITPQNTSTGEDPTNLSLIPTGNWPQFTIVNNLSQLTTYEITITVCPDLCIDLLSESISQTTGIGLPAAIDHAVLYLNGSICIASWSWRSSDVISGFEMRVKSVLAHIVKNEEFINQNEEEYMEILRFRSQDLKTTIKMLPNRKYSIFIGAVNCAGVAPMMEANGTCISDRAAPSVVPAAVIGSTFSGNTRDIMITLPDESNGPISCLFLWLKPTRNFTGDELASQYLHSTSDKNSSNLVVAIERSILIEKVFTVTLGDSSVTSCEINGSLTGETKDDETLLYQAKNSPLKTEEIYYYYVATATSTEMDGIQFQNSVISSFVNIGKEDSSTTWILAMVASLSVIVVGVSVFIYYKICRRSSGNEASDATTIETPVVQPIENIQYENVQLEESRIYQEIQEPCYENYSIETKS